MDGTTVLVTLRLERMPVARSQGYISDVSMQTVDYADQGRP